MKQNRKTKYTQMVLKDSLIELMKEKSIARITIKELCEKADINRTTFYAHYTDQYQLLKSLEEETLTWVKEIIAEFSGKTTQGEVMENLKKVIEHIIENRNHIQVLMSEQGNIDFQRSLLGVIYEQCGIWLVNDMKAELIRNEQYFIFLVNGSVGLIQHWLKNGLKESANEIAEIIYQMTANLRPEST